MAIVLEQTAYATIAKYSSRTGVAYFARPTKPGSLIVIAVAAAGTTSPNINTRLSTPDNFQRIVVAGLRDIETNLYYRPASPSMTSASITAIDNNKSLQIRMFEYSGMAQTNVLDKIQVRTSEDTGPYSGDTGPISQADELVLSFVVNQYSSTAQYSFRGALARLFESISPQSWSGGSNFDWERSRMTVHQTITAAIASFRLECNLSTTRRWISIIVTFRGGNIGPIKFSSTQQNSVLTCGNSKATLTLFGPLSSGKNVLVPVPTMLKTNTTRAWIGPSNYQYRLGGRTGLLIGSGTQFNVEGTEGLGGWSVRTSDEDRPRGDGAHRGIDLESARQILFKLNVGRGRLEVERNMDALLRALVPQIDTDWELIWRHPTGPLKMMRVRPIEALRNRDNRQLTIMSQTFALRAADPRHYNAIPTTVTIPVTPANAVDPQKTRVFNLGNSAAYPIITFKGPSFGVDVRRIQLVNETALVNFEAELTLSRGSILVADMDARITGAPRSIITLDGQTKYGAWQLPRQPFRIDPDPTGFGGYNELYLRTEPAGAPVVCTIEYRDTWAG